MKPKASLHCRALTFLAAASIAALAASHAWSAPPEILRIQGTITSLDGVQVVAGDYLFRVEIYDGAGQEATLEYDQDVTANVSGGAYTLVLSPLPPDQPGDLNAAFTEGPRFLEITVLTGPLGDINQTLQPRQEIASVPFALNASGASGSWSPGDIKIAAYDPTTPPEGWLSCDGQVYDGALPEYADLYAAIGTAFNVGAEVNDEFRVPDLRGKFPAGFYSGGDGDGDFAQIGETGGDKTHNHGGATGEPIEPLHNKVNDPDHYVAAPDHTHSLSSDTHIPPYVTLGFLIKY